MTETHDNDQDITNINTRAGRFAIQKIYVKDVSFETPHSPVIFTEDWSPKVDMQLGSKASKVNEELTEVVLTVTLTTTLGEKTAYLVEVHVAGIFLIKDFPEEAIEQMVATICPNILFPFTREIISDLVTRGGFPQLLLAPVNFDALYIQQKKQEEDKQAGNADSDSTKH